MFSEVKSAKGRLSHCDPCGSRGKQSHAMQSLRTNAPARRQFGGKQSHVAGNALAIFLMLITNIAGFAIADNDRERFRAEIERDKRDFEFDRKEITQEKFWDARLNKVITDIHGNRVRVEEFVTRPTANQVKFIALSKRKDRLDYMWFLQEFNKDLSQNMRGIAFQMEWVSKPEIYPIKQTKFVSNIRDSIEYSYENNKIINPISEDGSATSWVIWPGKITTKINSQVKAIQDNSFFPVPKFTPGMPKNIGGDYPTGGQWYRTDYPWDNTFMKRERFITDDSGNIQNLYIIPDHIKKIEEHYNVELIYSASEFEGRTIDLFVIPRIFMKYGSNNPVPSLGSALVFY